MLEAWLGGVAVQDMEDPDSIPVTTPAKPRTRRGIARCSPGEFTEEVVSRRDGNCVDRLPPVGLHGTKDDVGEPAEDVAGEAGWKSSRRACRRSTAQTPLHHHVPSRRLGQEFYQVVAAGQDQLRAARRLVTPFLRWAGVSVWTGA